LVNDEIVYGLLGVIELFGSDDVFVLFMEFGSEVVD